MIIFFGSYLATLYVQTKFMLCMVVDLLVEMEYIDMKSGE